MTDKINRRRSDRIKTRFLHADDPTRFPSDWPAHVEQFGSREYPLQLTHSGVYGFPRILMGDVGLAYAFYDDPTLVHDIMDTYTDMAIKIWEKSGDEEKVLSLKSQYLGVMKYLKSRGEA